MEIYGIKDWLELLSYAAAIIGIPLAIFIYYKDKIKERKIMEKEVLFTSHSLYVDYLKLCLSNPELEVYNIHRNGIQYSEHEKKELIIFEILFTYLESTFLYYMDQSDEIRNKRWEGWIKYIEEFSRQKNFLNAWQITNGQWDEDFMRFMNEIIKHDSLV